jgi:peptide/nickel transport system ATP-binding protein
MSTILITHDLGLAATYCDRLVIMERGRVVEQAAATDVFARPQHPYTQRLMRATPRPGISIRDLLPAEIRVPDPPPPPEPLPLLEVEGLTKIYGSYRAVDGISFSVGVGESVGLVGESGCGKSTTSLMVMRLLDPSSGVIRFGGRDLAAIPADRFATDADRGKLQMVFQDATESLNPRYTAARAIADPLHRLGSLSGAALRARIDRLADLVGLPRNLLERFPHQLSGGQKARVGIARAIALDPKLLILDEPTAALDVSIQAVILQLLDRLRREDDLALLFVSHDLNVVRMMCDTIVVLQQGKIVEAGDSAAVFNQPQAPYTRALLDAIPHFDPHAREAKPLQAVLG